MAAAGKRWHLVAYDIHNPLRLRQAAKLLEGYGRRVQNSLFSCRLSENEREKMRWELNAVLDKNDSLLVFPICERCMDTLRELDDHKHWPGDPKTYALI